MFIMNPNLKQIAISKQNYILLKSLGQAGESFNDVVSRLLKSAGTVVTTQQKKTEDVN
jgi:predicted CopG family antitoxin